MSSSIPAQPAEVSGEPTSSASPLPRPRRKHDPLNPEPFRIVVVDDEELIVEIINLMIRAKYEVEIKSFTSSQAAWEELDQPSPDMLITGGIMPEPHGEEIVRRLMARKATYPILVVSGYLKEEVVLGWFPDATNISFLPKPIDAAHLYAALEKHFMPMPADHCTAWPDNAARFQPVSSWFCRRVSGRSFCAL